MSEWHEREAKEIAADLIAAMETVTQELAKKVVRADAFMEAARLMCPYCAGRHGELYQKLHRNHGEFTHRSLTLEWDCKARFIWLKVSQEFGSAAEAAR